MQVVMKLAGADDQIMMYHADKLHWLADTTLLDSLLDQLSAQVRFMYTCESWFVCLDEALSLPSSRHIPRVPIVDL